jgi:CRP/FNR family transcriptional regulator
MTSTFHNSLADACHSACQACGFSGLCLPSGLDTSATANFSGITERRIRLSDAQTPLYWAGDEFHNVYAVREGCLKAFSVDSAGNENVRAFHLPGDLVGLDAIHMQKYPANAVALESSEICVIPYANLVRMVSNVPALQRRILEILSHELSVSLALAGDYTAEQRLAAFILHLYQRLRRRNLTNGNTMWLVMPRRDIARYLRLAVETVSRVLGRFEHECLIEVTNRHLKILDMAALGRMAEPVGICDIPVVIRHGPLFSVPVSGPAVAA